MYSNVKVHRPRVYSVGGSGRNIPVSPAEEEEFQKRSIAMASKVSNYAHVLCNEPSIGLYRIQEHVQKSIPQLAEKRRELDSKTDNTRQHILDVEFSIETIQQMKGAQPHLSSIRSLLQSSTLLAEKIVEQQRQRLARSRTSGMDHKILPNSRPFFEEPRSARQPVVPKFVEGMMNN
eukprot:TRINITY_DN1594_c0_g1_i1.p1 TRINITY_DN1594_c0_g1~~TRINITY_DN1594_c0_g1_i1.p1  ORF type:complete len:177 (-),score=32.19 TRINITY_DN1594_c0_g1_i1:479-1009(-)